MFWKYIKICQMGHLYLHPQPHHLFMLNQYFIYLNLNASLDFRPSRSDDDMLMTMAKMLQIQSKSMVIIAVHKGLRISSYKYKTNIIPILNSSFVMAPRFLTIFKLLNFTVFNLSLLVSTLLVRKAFQILKVVELG
jgi:hypothetical protein